MYISTVCVVTPLLAFILTDGVEGWVSGGSHFIVVCPSVSTSSPTVDCILHVMGSEGVLVNLTGSTTGLPKIETISSALILRVILQGNYPNSQAIIVSTSSDVSIFVEHNSQAGVGVYLAIPIGTDLTQPYTGSTIENYLMSLPVSSSEENMYVIASAYEDTLVTLTLKSTGSFVYDSATYSDGGTLSATLSAGGVLEIITGEDLTGTTVVSTKPVTLFMGTRVEPSLEQIPPVSRWEDITIVLNLDICSGATARFLSSLNGTLDILKMSGDLHSNMAKGIYQDVQYNETLFAQNLKHLVGISCTIDNKRIALFNAPGSGFGLEFKCLALAGYSNSAFVLNQKKVNYTYDVSGVDVPFLAVDTYNKTTDLSTMKGQVGEGYFIMNDVDIYSPSVVGFNTNGAYALSCAKGGLGSLLPDPLHSLVDVPLAVFSPSPTPPSSTLEILSSSDVNIDVSSPASVLSSSDVMIFSSSEVDLVSTSDVGMESSVDVSLTSFAMSSSNDVESIVPSSVMYAASSSVLPSVATSTETSLNVTDTTTEEVCFCRCGENEMLPEETQAFLEEYDIEIKKNLTLDSKTLSAYIRTKTSADDPRPSAHNVGYFGVVMLCVPFAFLMFSDLLNIFQMASPKKKSA